MKISFKELTKYLWNTSQEQQFGAVMTKYPPPWWALAVAAFTNMV